MIILPGRRCSGSARPMPQSPIAMARVRRRARSPSTASGHSMTWSGPLDALIRLQGIHSPIQAQYIGSFNSLCSTPRPRMERAHAFAMPSRQEGFGIVYVEAMRYGLSVTASVHDSGREANLAGAIGFNVDLARRHELSERLIRLLGDIDLAESMGQAGFRRW
jgi:glycosyltransferase involved in cell wall biosynthesis